MNPIVYNTYLPSHSLRQHLFYGSRLESFRNAKKAQEEAEKKILELEARSALAKSNKLAFEEAVQLKQAEKHYNKCVGDRQSILLKSCDKRKFTRTGSIKGTLQYCSRNQIATLFMKKYGAQRGARFPTVLFSRKNW